MQSLAWFLALCLNAHLRSDDTPAAGVTTPAGADAASMRAGSAPALPSAPRLTLAEAIAFARAHHPLLTEARARVTARVREEAMINARWLPRLGAAAEIIAGSANNTTAEYLSPPLVDQPRVGATRVTSDGSDRPSYAPYASTYVAVGLRQQLYDFGRTRAQNHSAAALSDAERQNTRAAALDVELGVKLAFYGARAARALYEAAHAAYRRAVLHHDMVRAAVKAGMRPTVDLTREEAELARDEARRLAAIGVVRVAQSDLAAAIGASEPAIDAREPEIDARHFEWTAPDLRLPPSLDEALAHDPGFLAARALLAAQKAKTQAAVSEFLPNLSLSAAFSGREGGAPPTSGAPARYHGLVPDVPNWNIGLVLSVPIFDGVNVAARRASASVEDVLAAHLEVMAQRARARLRQAFNLADAARQALPALNAALTAAESNAAQAEARFTNGLGTAVDLADAEALLTDAEERSITGRLDFARAKAVFDRVLAEEFSP